MRSEILANDHNKSIDLFLYVTGKVFAGSNAAENVLRRMFSSADRSPGFFSAPVSAHGVGCDTEQYNYTGLLMGAENLGDSPGMFFSPLVASTPLNVMQANAQVMWCLHL